LRFIFVLLGNRPATLDRVTAKKNSSNELCI
jgi:hypothetical protein